LKYKLLKIADPSTLTIKKKNFSVVLLALINANYKFVVVDIGGYGKSSDGGTFSNSVFGKRLEESRLNIPEPRLVPLLLETKHSL
jgi:hypothetical protein